MGTRPTGARFREPNLKDWHLENVPGVAEALSDTLPANYIVLPTGEIQITYNQGAQPSCVAYSQCGVKSLQDYLDSDKTSWIRYDGNELYLACGGDGINGIFTDRALNYQRDVGTKELGAETRRKIAGYAFAPRVPGVWRQVIAAALVSSGPCVLATLLPTAFNGNSNETLTGDYHQMAVIGYTGLRDTDRVILLNSWPDPVFPTMTWRVLENGNFQDGHAFAYQMIDVDDLAGIPTPDPPVGVVSFSATLKKLSRNRLEFRLDSPNTSVPRLVGQRLEFHLPIEFASKAKIATETRLVVKLKNASQDSFTEGMVPVSLHVG